MTETRERPTCLYVGPQDSTATALDAAGFDTRHTSSVEAATDVLRTTSVDCVVAVHDPPSFDSFELLETVREVDDLPVVIDSTPGSVDDTTLAETLADPGVAYVQRTNREGRPVLASRIRSAVADDGPGIPAEDREWVFERGHTTDEEGTGFGLAIVESVADDHDWSVWVEESESGGARFVFSGVERPE